MTVRYAASPGASETRGEWGIMTASAFIPGGLATTEPLESRLSAGATSSSTKPKGWQPRLEPRPCFDRVPGARPVCKVVHGNNNVAYVLTDPQGGGSPAADAVPLAPQGVGARPEPSAVAKLWLEGASHSSDGAYAVFPGQSVRVRWAVPADTEGRCSLVVSATRDMRASGDGSIDGAWFASNGAADEHIALVTEALGGPLGEATIIAPAGPGVYLVELLIGCRLSSSSMSPLREWAGRIGTRLRVVAAVPHSCLHAVPGAVSAPSAAPRRDAATAVRLVVINRVWCPANERKRLFVLIESRSLHGTASESPSRRRMPLPLGSEDRLTVLPAAPSAVLGCSQPLHLRAVLPPPVLSEGYLSNAYASFPGEHGPAGGGPTSQELDAGAVVSMRWVIDAPRAAGIMSAGAWLVHVDATAAGSAAGGSGPASPLFRGVMCFEAYRGATGRDCSVPGTYAVRYAVSSQRGLVVSAARVEWRIVSGVPMSLMTLCKGRTLHRLFPCHICRRAPGPAVLPSPSSAAAQTSRAAVASGEPRGGNPTPTMATSGASSSSRRSSHSTAWVRPQ